MVSVIVAHDGDAICDTAANSDEIAVIGAAIITLGSNYIIRTHKHRSRTKRELPLSVQPLATRNIDSLLNNPRIFIMSNANQNNANRNLSQPQDGREQIDAATASMNSFPGGFHAIATAYSDYTKKSFEDTRAFVEKLSGAKSVDKAIEIQTEFAKSAFETFMAESQKIGALYRDLATQSYKPFGDLLAKITPTNR